MVFLADGFHKAFGAFELLRRVEVDFRAVLRNRVVGCAEVFAAEFGAAVDFDDIGITAFGPGRAAAFEVPAFARSL